MRKFYFLLAAFIALGFSAQEAGKAGELLKTKRAKPKLLQKKMKLLAEIILKINLQF